MLGPARRRRTGGRIMRWLHGAASLVLAFAASQAVAGVPEQGGPYNVNVLAGGVGVERDLNAPALVAAGSSFSFSAWVRPELAQDGTVTLLALGAAGADCRCLVLTDGRLAYQSGGETLTSRERIAPGEWAHVALSSEGDQATLYVNGRRVARGRIAAVATLA
ncbi:MAG: LamG domain-containing protein, partial [Brevundimonas sp.]